jgi:hypothetical protein
MFHCQTRLNFSYPEGSKHLQHAPVAQLDRAIDYESIGRAFESLRVRHFFYLTLMFAALVNHSCYSLTAPMGRHICADTPLGVYIVRTKLAGVRHSVHFATLAAAPLTRQSGFNWRKIFKKRGFRKFPTFCCLAHFVRVFV